MLNYVTVTECCFLWLTIGLLSRNGAFLLCDFTFLNRYQSVEFRNNEWQWATLRCSFWKTWNRRRQWDLVFGTRFHPSTSQKRRREMNHLLVVTAWRSGKKMSRLVIDRGFWTECRLEKRSPLFPWKSVRFWQSPQISINSSFIHCPVCLLTLFCGSMGDSVLLGFYSGDISRDIPRTVKLNWLKLRKRKDLDA